MTKPIYQDLGDLDEDKRIDRIGHTVMDRGKLTAFVVEDDAKADRYITKLKAKFPGIVVKGRGAGPAVGMVYVTLSPP